MTHEERLRKIGWIIAYWTDFAKSFKMDASNSAAFNFYQGRETMGKNISELFTRDDDDLETLYNNLINR